VDGHASIDGVGQPADHLTCGGQRLFLDQFSTIIRFVALIEF
jgi:hypothetical protein